MMKLVGTYSNGRIKSRIEVELKFYFNEKKLGKINFAQICDVHWRIIFLYNEKV